MITQALTAELYNIWSSRNCACNSGSIYAVDQTKKSQQYGKWRRKDNIKLKQLFLATYNVQKLQQTGKLD